MWLHEAQIGKAYEIQTMTLPSVIEKRLQALGMTLGSVITVLNNKNRGTLIVKVRGTRFAIGRSITSRIEVREQE